MKFKGILKTIEKVTTKHSPEILLGLGIAGGITTTVLAVKATPKALTLLEEEKRSRRKNDEDDKLKPIEVVKTAWKPYIPAVVSGITSIACVVGSHSINAKRNAVIATAYKLTETAFSEYRDAVVEQIGEKKEQEIQDKVSEKHVRKAMETNEVIITGNGKTLFYDPIIDRLFESDLQTVRRVINDINAQIIHQDYISLNEFYYALGLKQVETIGDQMGWNVNSGLIDIKFGTCLTEDGRPAIALKYKVEPRYDYSKLW